MGSTTAKPVMELIQRNWIGF